MITAVKRMTHPMSGRSRRLGRRGHAVAAVGCVLVIGCGVWVSVSTADAPLKPLTQDELARLTTAPPPAETGSPAAAATAATLASCCTTADPDRRALVEAALLAHQPAVEPLPEPPPWDRLAWRVRAWAAPYTGQSID